MTIEQIAHALGLDEKTIDRDSKSIAESFRAGGIDLASLNLADMKVVLVVIVDELQKKCPDVPNPSSSAARDSARFVVDAPASGLFRADERAGLPRRFRGKP